MQTSLKSKWNNNEKLLNGWVTFSDSFSSEVFASAGFDSITVDLQHGMLSFESMVAILQSIGSFNILPIVRVLFNEASIISKSLDAGAEAIICPMVNNIQDCKNFVSACRYPPTGIRSYGPTRAALHCNDEYLNSFNSKVVSFAMIETRESVENLDSILSIKELDAIYIGPFDLAISLGINPLRVFEDETTIDAISHILDVSKKNRKRTAIHCPNGKIAGKYLDLGFDLATISTDADLLKKVASEEIKNAKK